MEGVHSRHPTLGPHLWLLLMVAGGACGEAVRFQFVSVTLVKLTGGKVLIELNELKYSHPGAETATPTE